MLNARFTNKTNMVLLVLGIIALSTFGYLQYDKHKQAEIAKDREEKRQIAKRMQEAGAASAKALAQNSSKLPFDPTDSEASLAEGDDMAQAKVWHSLPPKQRDLVRDDFHQQNAQKASEAIARVE